MTSAVADVRALLAARGRPASTWEVGPSSTPPDLVERLLALARSDKVLVDNAPVGDPGAISLH